MKNAPLSTPDSHWPDRVLILLAGLLLLLPILDMGLHLDPTSPRSENRLLATLPDRPAHIGEIQHYVTGCEAYFNDHFGCRKVLIMWQAKLIRFLFKDNNDRHDVMVGTDGWLFYSTARMIDHYRGELQFTESELNNWKRLLEHRRDWLAQRGIQYVFVLAPDKQSIYPEFLPAWLKDLCGRTKADQFFAYMKAHSSVSVVDLRPPLLAAKKSVPVFQKTDTHWNQWGAFLGYTEIIHKLAAQQSPELTALSVDDFVCVNQPTLGGDLASMLGVNRVEDNAFHFTPRAGLPVLEIFDPKIHPNQLMAFSKQPRRHDLAMVYQDSFGRYWLPFLGCHFGEVDYYWQYHFNAGQITQKKPSVVISEMVERVFNLENPQNLEAKDVLP